MGRWLATRRTGVVTAGLVPPPGVPLPQHTVPVIGWTGRLGELRDPALREALVRTARMRRFAEAGALRAAVREAVEIDVAALGEHPGERRAVGTLRAAGAARGWIELGGVGALVEVLRLVGDPPPEGLLDALLADGSMLDPDEVARAWREVDRGKAGERRLLLLRLRLWARRAAKGDAEALRRILQDVEAVSGLPGLLENWRRMLDAAARARDLGWLDRLADALGPNLALVEGGRGDLYDGIKACFARFPQDRARELTRLAFSAWSALLAVEEGRRPAELESFSAHATAFRQVFEKLLAAAVAEPFLVARPDCERPEGRRLRMAGLGTWADLLFGDHSGRKELRKALRAWFEAASSAAPLREGRRLQDGLEALLEVELNRLPHDEAAARARARELLRVVAEVGFGARPHGDGVTWPRKRGGRCGGLVGALVDAALLARGEGR